MKEIQLDLSQKVKLLEMCKILFPEYEIELHGSNIYFLPTTNYIHWFEFCMTILAEKILNPNNEISKFMMKKIKKFYYRVSTYSWFMQDPGVRESFVHHPVDYLYEEFKKLK